MNTVIRTVSPLLVVSGAALESAVLLGHPPISAGGRDLMIGVGVSLVVVGLMNPGGTSAVGYAEIKDTAAINSILSMPQIKSLLLLHVLDLRRGREIGRASCRERV